MKAEELETVMNFGWLEDGGTPGDAAPSPRCNRTENRDEGVAAPVTVVRKCMTAPLTTHAHKLGAIGAKGTVINFHLSTAWIRLRSSQNIELWTGNIFSTGWRTRKR